MPLPTTTDPAARRKQLASRMLWAERIVTAFAIVALVLGHGVPRLEEQVVTELGYFVAAVMLFLTGGLAWRAMLSDDWQAFAMERLPQVAAHVLWIVLLPAVIFTGLPGFISPSDPLRAALQWTELMFWLRTLTVALRIIRLIAAARTNPAIVLVGSFALLITVGTLLLMLPICRSQPQEATTEVGAPLDVALFTATSATCVTGLIVVDTATYWTREGQLVILALIQLGGLGIMTFGAFFALGQRRGFLLRESVFIGKLLEANDLQAVRKLVITILWFTLVSELIGAALLTTAAPPGPVTERLYYGVFHSISSFCNAGFALQETSFEGQGARWQIWGVVAPLIIIGGMGFEVLRNLFEVALAAVRSRWPGRERDHQDPPPRLTATTRLVVTTTLILLSVGALAFFILENDNVLGDEPLGERVADTWFQSVTARTAGFNTVDVSSLRAGTRLVIIMLMFIGASPGSAGGGIKTTVFALMLLATAATVEGRERVEVGARTVPDGLVKKAAVVVAMALSVLLTSTLLIVMFEQQPELFLDHLFEATSALGTVGLSTLGTGNLRQSSQLVIIVTMFVGRVGPLTLLVAIARRRPEAKYEYPSERVMIG
jgi:trk system potassium uptake protein